MQTTIREGSQFFVTPQEGQLALAYWSEFAKHIPEWRLAQSRKVSCGRVSKAHNNVILTAAVLKKTLGLVLSPEEKRVEAHLNRRGN
jgi:hypothetical protein